MHQCIHAHFNGFLSITFSNVDPCGGRQVSQVNEGVDEGWEGMGVSILWPLNHGMVMPWLTVVDAWMGPLFVSLSGDELDATSKPHIPRVGQAILYKIIHCLPLQGVSIIGMIPWIPANH